MLVYLFPANTHLHITFNMANFKNVHSVYTIYNLNLITDKNK